MKIFKNFLVYGIAVLSILILKCVNCDNEEVSRADVTVAMVTSCRCQELEEQLGRQEEELKSVSEQLLMAVQQKFKLQQQIEAWQVRTRYQLRITVEFFSSKPLK